MKKALYAQKMRLKELAKEIHDLRLTRKKMPNGVVPGLANKSHESRHRHIAYCLIRGKTMEQIEKPRPGNEASKRLIDLYTKEIQDAAVNENKAEEPAVQIHVAVEQWSGSNGNESEAVCAGAQGSVTDAKDGSILSRCGRALSALFGSVGK